MEITITRGMGVCVSNVMSLADSLSSLLGGASVVRR